MFVVLLLIFLFFTMLVKINGSYDNSYLSCAISVVAVLGSNIIMGPALMFYSMEGKHDMQALMLLPASNLEKYLIRYVQWLILLPIYLVAIFGADLLQYLIHLMAGHDYGRSVLSVLVNDFVGGIIFSPSDASEASHPRFILSLTVIVIWAQSLYALGATLFRSRKFNWIITTVAIILLGLLFYKVAGYVEFIQLNDHSPAVDYAVGYGFYLVWTVINYWLSYRQFCRTQVIGKFINV